MFDLYSWNTSNLSEVRIAEWLVHRFAKTKFVGLILHCVRFFFCLKLFAVFLKLCGV